MSKTTRTLILNVMVVMLAGLVAWRSVDLIVAAGVLPTTIVLTLAVVWGGVMGYGLRSQL